MAVPRQRAATQHCFQLQVLGPSVARYEACPLDLSGWPKKAASLFRLLAVIDGHRIEREEAIELLWPEVSIDAGTSNLKGLIHRVRRLMEAQSLPTPLVLRHGYVLLNPDCSFAIDVDRFTALANSTDASIPQLEEARALFRGTPLPEEKFEDWAVPARDELDRLFRDVSLHLARAHEAKGAWNDALRVLQSLAVVRPIDEEVAEELIRLMGALGRPADATQVYRAFEERLQRELGLYPGKKLQAAAARTDAENPMSSAPSQTLTQSKGGFLGAHPDHQLIGREEEMDFLLSKVDTVVQGQGQAVLLIGEPGVGKTRLVQEAAVHLALRGFLVTTGRCYENRQSVPYYPFLDVLTQLYERAEPAVQEQYVARYPYLGFFLPNAGIPALPRASSVREDQVALFRAVSELVQRIAETEPVAILVDDLHWADASSLDLLTFLMRHVRNSRVLIVASIRESEIGVSQRLRDALLLIKREDLADEMPVPRLNLHATTQLISSLKGQPASPEFAASVYSRTNGNAFFIREICRSLGARGDQDDIDVKVPDTVRMAIERQTARLGGEVKQALEEASVLGESFSYGELHGISELPAADLDRALDRAIRAKLVRPINPHVYRFDHALTQHTMYQNLLPGRRLQLEVAAAEMLAGLSEREQARRAPEIARHFLLGGQEARALPLLLSAGDTASAIFAHTEAEQSYRAALQLAEKLGETPRMAEAAEKLGSVLTVQSRTPEALRLLEKAVSLYRLAGDREGMAHATESIAQAHLLGGTAADGATRIEELLIELQDAEPSPALATTYSLQASLLYHAGKYDEGLRAAERASELGRLIGALRTTVQRRSDAWYVAFCPWTHG